MGMIEAVEAAIARHLPPADPGSRIGDEEDALVIVNDATHPTGGYSHWRPDDELATLREMERAAAAVKLAFGRLHPDLRNAVRHGMTRAGYKWHMMVDGLGPAVAAGVRQARSEIEAGGPRTRHDFRAAGVVATCREVWRRRTGRDAPRSMNDARPGPFGRFLVEVLDATGMPGSASAAMRSWRDVNRSG